MVLAFLEAMNQAEELEKKQATLEKLTGYSIDTIIELLAKGWELKPPSPPERKKLPTIDPKKGDWLPDGAGTWGDDSQLENWKREMFDSM